MKSKNPLEKDIEKAVVKHAKSLGILCYKFTSPMQRSVPDRVFLYKGRTWWIEFKRAGEKPTKAQEIEIAKIRDNGGSVWVVDDVQEGKRIIEAMMRPSLERYAFEPRATDLF